ncbi:response regulator transcription factor [Streptomyces pseudovenezuelae]|uniref:response regulator transcription factor n=1 Tax=Streptomyces pseudovenezuelae TaxID=67350 RepID=UPI00371DA691
MPSGRDDDPKQADLIRRYLEREGHAVGVVHAGRAALEEVRRRMPDLLVLDRMMPRTDGLDVCRVLRRESVVPILMLTARAEEDDLLLALDLGADDYMTKPFGPRELVARIGTLLRRAGQDAGAGAGAGAGARAEPVFAVGSLVVDPARFEVRVDGRLTECAPGEFRVFEMLASAPGWVFTRKQILEQLQGIDRYVTGVWRPPVDRLRRPGRRAHAAGRGLPTERRPRRGGVDECPAQRRGRPPPTAAGQFGRRARPLLAHLRHLPEGPGAQDAPAMRP